MYGLVRAESKPRTPKIPDTIRDDDEADEHGAQRRPSRAESVRGSATDQARRPPASRRCEAGRQGRRGAGAGPAPNGSIRVYRTRKRARTPPCGVERDRALVTAVGRIFRLYCTALCSATALV